MNTESLVPARTAGSLPATNPELDDLTRKLFGSFREVFSAENQLERAVFWLEEQRGQLILRHVRNLSRKRKGEDYLVGRAGNNLDAVRVAIGNFTAGASMTTICWELFADFGLTKLIEFGRFDFRDLLPDIESFADIAKKGIQLIGDWDFDSIFLSHQCPNCYGVYNRESVIYIPYFECEKCGKVPTLNQGYTVVNRMLNKFRQRQTIAVHPRRKNSDRFAVQRFVDPLPNSIIYWWIMSQMAEAIDDPRSRLEARQQLILQAVYRISLFKFMTIPSVREFFQRYLEEIGEGDWELFLGQMSKFGELLDTVEPNRRMECLKGCSWKYVEVALPLLINRVIMGTALCAQKEKPSHEKGE